MKPITDSFSSGIKLLLVAHLYYLATCALYFLVIFIFEKQGINIIVDQGAIGIIFFIMIAAPGIVGQLVYVIPITLSLALKKSQKALKGLLTGALITALLNVVILFIAVSIGISLSPDTTPKREKNQLHIPKQMTTLKGEPNTKTQ
jgi:hypothetical protein